MPSVSGLFSKLKRKSKYDIALQTIEPYKTEGGYDIGAALTGGLDRDLLTTLFGEESIAGIETSQAQLQADLALIEPFKTDTGEYDIGAMTGNISNIDIIRLFGQEAFDSLQVTDTQLQDIAAPQLPDVTYAPDASTYFWQVATQGDGTMLTPEATQAKLADKALFEQTILPVLPEELQAEYGKVPELEFNKLYDTWRDMQRKDLVTQMEKVFPDLLSYDTTEANEHIATLFLEQILTDENSQRLFVETLQKQGRNEDTEKLLKLVAPGISDSDVAEIFQAPALTYQETITQRLRQPTLTYAEMTEEEKEKGEVAPQWFTDEAVNEFWQLTPTRDNVREWYVKHQGIEPGAQLDMLLRWRTGDQSIGLGWFDKFAAVFTAGVGDMAQSVAGAIRWLGLEDKLNADAISSWGAEQQKYGENITGTGWSIARSLPSQLVFLPLSFTGAGLGLAAARALGAGKILTWIAGSLSSVALSRPAESMLEVGSSYDELVKQYGKVEADKRAANIFWGNMALSGWDAIQMATALAPLPKNWVSLAKTSKLIQTVKVGGKTVVVGLTEGGEEVYQEVLQKIAQGKEIVWDEDLQTAMIVGGLMGGIMGFGGDFISTLTEKTTEVLPEKDLARYDTLFNEAKEQGLNDSLAQVQALEALATESESAAQALQATIEKLKTDAPLQVSAKEAQSIKVTADTVLQNDAGQTILTLLEKTGWQPGIYEDISVSVFEDLTGQQPAPNILTSDLNQVKAGEAQKILAKQYGYPNADELRIAINNVATAEMKSQAVQDRLEAGSEAVKVAQAQAELEGIQETLTQDKVANYKFQIGTTKTGKPNMRNLEALISIREGTLLDTFTVKQAQMLNPNKSYTKYSQPGTRFYNKVPRGEVLDSIATELGFEDSKALAEHITGLRKTRQRMRVLERIIKTAPETLQSITEPITGETGQIVPPVKPPPPQSVIPPLPPIPSNKGNEMARIITQSKEQVRQDKANSLTKLFHAIPGLKQLTEFEQPALKMTGENVKVLEAMVAENAARADVSVWATGTRMGLLRDIRKVFGKDALKGGQVDAKFNGTAEQAKNPLTGTLKDIADNPELYSLSDDQLRVLNDINVRNDQLLDVVVNGYNAEIGKFQPKPNGAFLPNVDISEDVIEYIGSETRAASTGRGKTRIWQTARERMAHDKSFKPETDVQKLIEGLDNFKAQAAGGQTYRQAIGGLTRLEVIEKTHPELYKRMTGLQKRLQSLRGSAGRLDAKLDSAVSDFLNSPYEVSDLMELRENLDVKLATGARAGMNIEAIQAEIDSVKAEIAKLRPMWESANPKPYVFVQDNIFRYFPSDQAQLIRESRKVSNNPVINLIEKWRGQAFSGDMSPFAIQGVLGVLADPWGSLKAGMGGLRTAIQTRDWLRSFKIDALADDIANNPVEWGEFASLMGRGLTGTPKEYAAGFLSKINFEIFGKQISFDKFTESTYITVTRGGFNLWQRTYKNMVKHGIPELEAKVTAADLASKIYPLVSASRLGQSQSRSSFLRALPTSYSFIRQPASLVGSASKGFAKIITRQPLTAQESLATKTVIIGGASTLAVSATSAALSALAAGGDADDVKKAIWDAINPDPYNGKFCSIIIGGKRVPLGGPYRAIFRAIYPQEVEGIPVPLPFAGLFGFKGYLFNRITPALRTQWDIFAKNKDYYGIAIRKGEGFEPFLRALIYEFENFLPLTAGAAVEAVRQGEGYKENILEQVIAQFMGVNLVTLNNTYIDRQIKQLGLPKETEPKPYEVQKVEVYSTKDLWGDVNRVLSLRTQEAGYDDKPVTQAIIEARHVKAITDALPNDKLINLDFDLIQQRQDLTGDALAAFDKDHPTLSGIGQREYVALLEYFSLTGEEQKQFLEDHPELNVNPRTEWLISHPLENAQLAIWGQAKVYTQEAYDKAMTLIKELDIPESALPEKTFPPAEIAEDYFEYLKVVESTSANSWETQLILAQNNQLTDFLNREPITTPVKALELKVKNRDLYDLRDSYSDKDSPDYIADEEARAEAIKALKEANPEWVDDMRRVEAIESNGADYQEAWVERGKIIDQFSAGSSEAKLWLVDHPEVYQWALENELLTDDGKDWNIPVLRINVQYRTQDEEYNALPSDDDSRKQYLIDNPEYRDARARRDVFAVNGTQEIADLHVEYSHIVDEFTAGSAEAKLYRIDHPDYDAWGQQESTFKWASLADENIEALRINAKYRLQDEEYDNIKNDDAKIQAQMRETYLEENEDYRLARWQRDALTMQGVNGEKFTDDQIDLYVQWSELPTKGKRRDRFLIDNPEFAQSMHLIKGIDLPDKVPSVQYDDIYDQYQAQFEQLEGLSDITSPYYIEDTKERAKARESLRFNEDGTLTEFGIAEIRRDAYGIYIPDDYVERYVDYTSLLTEGRPDSWPEDLKGEPLTWYEDEWYLMEHPAFYENIYLGQLELEPVNFDLVPSREVFDKYAIYITKAEGKPREDYRAVNLDLEEWLLATKQVTTPIWKQSRRKTLSPTERKREDINELLERIKR